MTCRQGTLAALVALAVLPMPACAHGDLQSLAPFYAGLLHPLLEPSQCLALSALGLLVGQRGLATGHRTLSLLFIALALSLPAAGFARIDGGPALLAVGLACALCVGSAWRPPPLFLAVLGALVGIGVGLGSEPDRSAIAARLAAMAGSALGAMALVSLVAAASDAARAPWARIGVRVASSWLAASALLVLALSLAAPGQPSSVTIRPQVQKAASVPIT